MEKIKNILKETNQTFLSIWGNGTSVSILAALLITLYGVQYLMRGSLSNPVWILLWAFSCTYLASFLSIAYHYYMEQKALILEEERAVSADVMCEVKLKNGTLIGAIPRVDYLDAVYEADICMRTKALGVLNWISVAYQTVMGFVMVLPYLLLICAIGAAFIVPQDQMAEITLGQILVYVSTLTWSSSFAYMVFAIFALWVGLTVAFGGGLHALPGYKSYLAIRLKRSLAEHLPNIANADDFYVTSSET